MFVTVKRNQIWYPLEEEIKNLVLVEAGVELVHQVMELKKKSVLPLQEYKIVEEDKEAMIFLVIIILAEKESGLFYYST